MCNQCHSIPQVRKWDVYSNAYQDDDGPNGYHPSKHIGVIDAVSIWEASDKAIVQFGLMAHQMRIVYRT